MPKSSYFLNTKLHAIYLYPSTSKIQGEDRQDALDYLYCRQSEDNHDDEDVFETGYVTIDEDNPRRLLFWCASYYRSGWTDYEKYHYYYKYEYNDPGEYEPDIFSLVKRKELYFVNDEWAFKRIKTDTEDPEWYFCQSETDIINDLTETTTFFANGGWEQRLTNHILQSQKAGRSATAIAETIDSPGWDVGKISRLMADS